MIRSSSSGDSEAIGRFHIRACGKFMKVERKRK